MKKAMICLAVLFVVLGLCATVYAQAGGYNGPPPKTKICKPGAIPIVSGAYSQWFEAESHFEAQCTCNQAAEKYKQFVCYATSSETTAARPEEQPLWYCVCSKTKTW